MTYLEKFLAEHLRNLENPNTDDWACLAGYNILESKLAFSVGDGEEKKPDTIFMGVEWEVSAKIKACRKQVTELLRDGVGLYMHMGGGGDPMEMRTIPATLKYHRDYLEKKVFPHKHYESYAPPHSNLGIHIHISKAAFTEKSLKKFIIFNSNKENRKFIEDIAERPYNNQASWRRPNEISITYYETGPRKDRIRAADIVLDSNLRHIRGPSLPPNTSFPEGKSVAVNTQTGYPTVEYRIFRSSTTPQKFLKNIEFTDALVRYTRLSPLMRLDHRDFIRWLVLKAKDYPNLMKDEAITSRLTSVQKDYLEGKVTKHELRVGVSIKEKIKKVITRQKVRFAKRKSTG
jgi:hypothetical protein